jgi:hypothetical protein
MGWTSTQLERERELLYRFYCFTILRTCINAHRLSIHTSLVFTFFPTTLAILPNSSSRFLHAKNTRYQTPTYLVLEPCLSDQYHADNIPPLNTETISDRSNPPGTSTLTETRTRFHVNGPNESANRISCRDEEEQRMSPMGAKNRYDKQ